MPALAAAMAGDGDGPRTRFVDGTLCFADISGFTALTERLVRHGRVGAEALVETLSAVFGAMLDVAEARGGMLLKFGGDALLFLFQGDGHATRAASAAVEIRRSMRDRSRTPSAIGRLELTMSVGLHSAEFPFFLVGSSHRELVVVGADVTATIDTSRRRWRGRSPSPRDGSAAAAGSHPHPGRRHAARLRWRDIRVDAADDAGHRPP